ncbi:MAG: hypothetical protein H6719_29705 [Sandaracinaceae bacterium]|nr:hypothetical protein [Sandaracinaceae bacterium]
MSDREHDDDEVRIIGGMMASETPQQRAQRLIALLERGEVDEVRAIANARAAQTAAAFAKELASLDSE